MKNELKILHDPQNNQYYIGYKKSENRGITYWQTELVNWRLLRRTKCDSIEDVVELGETDALFVRSEIGGWN